jgi:hypothetical protein
MTSHVLHQQNITTREKMTSGELERSGQLTIANSLVQDILERPKKRMQISTFATCQDLVFKIEPIKDSVFNFCKQPGKKEKWDVWRELGVCKLPGISSKPSSRCRYWCPCKEHHLSLIFR